jgi:hypothetical protein
MPMQAVADALSLLANILMAWNTAQMQQVLDHWAQRRDGAVPPELGHMNGAGVSTVHGGDQVHGLIPLRADALEIDVGEADGAHALGNFGSVFRFPVERYAEKILPSSAAEKMTASAC